MTDVRKVKMSENLIEMLPQKEPFLFVESIEKLVPGQYCKVKRTIRKEEYYFKGHFPNRPVMPGCLLIESMAQAAELILISNDEDIVNEISHAYLVQVKNTLFYTPVIPEQVICIEVELVRKIGAMVEVSANIQHEGKRVAKGHLVLMLAKDETREPAEEISR